MILALDIGNTNTKIGIFKGDKLVESLRLSNSFAKTSDEYGFYVNNILLGAGIKSGDIDGAVMSSVNPNLNYTFEHMLGYYYKVKPMIVGSGIKSGIRIRYDNPREVGADRVMGCVAAYYNYGGNCIVVDCGTATTFNLVSGEGDFLGGAISFGLKSGSDALSDSAAKLPKVELNTPDTVIGRNTIACMQSGLIFGYTGMVEYMVSRLKAELGAPCRVIATGGLSEIVASCSNIFDTVDRSLTLKGLNIVYNLNK